MTRFDSILETIGRTPVVRIRRLAPSHVELWVKVESFNPLGSVKDRLALGIIEDAERSGALKPGQTVIEATSGNTGIGLAMVCASKGHPLVVVMAENFSIERRKMMRFLGARVVLTPAWAKGTGMIAKAVELAEAHGWFLCRQFENEANADVHSRTTAREVVADFEGGRLDYWVTGAGTGGTLKGVARILRQERPETQIVLCEPDNSPMVGSGIRQPRAADGTPSASHPVFSPHLVQGWSPDFIPKLTEDAIDLALVDRIVPVASDEAMRWSRELATKEGIFVGTSGGAAFAGALSVCASAAPGSVLLCMLPDTAERYLSTPLFDEVPAGMSAEEIAISESTAGARFDTVPPAPVATASDARGSAEPSARAEEFVRGALEDRDRAVVMFALQWCEFCWSVRRLFAHCGIAFRDVVLDSAELRRDDQGSGIRSVLARVAGAPTIPQVFIGGELVGGATEVFEAAQDGRLRKLLARHGVRFDERAGFDVQTLLPGWRQPATCPVRPR